MQKRAQGGRQEWVGLEQGWLGREPPQFQAEFRRLLVLRPVAAGKLVFASDDEADALYGIAEGRFAIRTPLVSGEEVVAHVSAPGFWVGVTMIASLERRRHIAAVARTDGVVASVPLSGLRAALQENPQWWYSIARLMECHWTLTACIARDLMLRRHRDRIVATLLRLAGLRPRPAIQAEALRIPVTHDEIATIANCSRSLVHAELRRIEDQGWIGLAYGSIRILSPEAMAASLAR
jgi:CRP-like cAMP-binding protein